MNPYIIHLGIMIGIFVLLSLALNLLLGYTGLLNLGIAALFGVGAYTSAILTLLGIPFMYALLLAILAGGICSLLIGIPSLRLRGEYFALATLGFGLLFESIIRNWSSVTHGSLGIAGISHPVLFGWVVDLPWEYGVLCLGFVLVVILLMYRLVSTPFGRLLRGIRDDETASLSLGKKVRNAKLVALFVAGLIAGLSGAFYAHYITFVDPSSFGVAEAILIVSMVVIGGLESIFGTVLGVTILILLPEPLRFLGIPSELLGPLRQLIYALMLILLVIYRPKGILGKVSI